MHSAAFFESKTVPKQYQEDGILGFLPFCKQLKKCKLLNLTCGKIVRLPPPPPVIPSWHPKASLRER